MTPAQLERILMACRAAFDFAPDTEITLEVNPGDAEPERLEACRNLGINRLSLGVQSFFDRDLALTGVTTMPRQPDRPFRWPAGLDLTT
jgi:oxygen-independent coproporphyrinogen-3 oxidase